LIPFVLNANVGQKNPRRVSLSFEFPTETVPHSAVRSVATDQITSPVARGFSAGGLDINPDAFVVLLRPSDLVSEEYLGVAGRFRGLEEQCLSPILGQNQKAIGGGDFFENA
jgi:hypothetical protein